MKNQPKTVKSQSATMKDHEKQENKNNPAKHFAIQPNYFMFYISNESYDMIDTFFKLK